MLKFFVRLITTMAALKGADVCLDNFNLHKGFFALLGFSLLLGIVNGIIKPVLVFFSVPLIILSIGLFYLCINALILYVTAMIIPGELTATGWGIFWGSVLVSFFHWVLTVILRVREKR